MEYLFIALFPLVFMLHEFEEIILLPGWLHAHAEKLGRRYPKIGNKLSALGELETPVFALAVLEEFIIVSVCTTIALATNQLTAWLCCFLAFSIHLILHLVQFFIFGKYIPALLTTVLGLPYCVWAFLPLQKQYTWTEMLLWGIVGSAACAVNLRGVHILAPKLWKRIIFNFFT